MGLLLHRAAFLVTKDTEKVEVLNAFFCHFCTGKECSHIPKPIGRVSVVNCERQNWEALTPINIHKCMQSGGVHPMANVIAKTLSIASERSQ